MTIERQRRRILATFVAANLAQDVCILVGNLGKSVAGFAGAVQQSVAFIKYDSARKYTDLTGGDFGEVINCPGHFNGQCACNEGGDE